MKRNILSFLAVILLGTSLLSCSREKAPAPGDISITDRPVRFGLIVGIGGFGDKSFNDMQYKGMIIAKKKFNIEASYKIPVKREDISLLARELIEEKCGIIFYSSTYDLKLIKDLARENPTVWFILVDNPVEASPIPDNIASISFKQNEGSFLAGAFAALMSRTGRIAVIGATDITVIRDFITGYRAGAQYVSPGIIVRERFLDKYDPGTSCWINTKGAREVSDDLYENSGVDIIFGVAGGSNIGIFQSAKNNSRFAIGVDADQDYLEQGRILTSMMKNLDQGIVFILEEYISGRLKNQNYRLGLIEGGVGLSPMQFTKHLTDENTMSRIEQIRRDIINGKIKVPTVYGKR